MNNLNPKIVAPSLLSANFKNMEAAVKIIEESGSQWLHLDVMDGNFVPNITFGPKMIKDLRPLTKLVFDVHLMIKNADIFIDDFAESGADYITVHYEAICHLHRTLTNIRKIGKKCGVSIIPSTPVEHLSEILPDIDLVLVMAVNPGFGGQKFIENSIKKVKKLNDLRKNLNLDFLISVDGGVSRNNADILRAAGADILVSGSSFFNSADKKKETEVLKGIVQ